MQSKHIVLIADGVARSTHQKMISSDAGFSWVRSILNNCEYASKMPLGDSGIDVWFDEDDIYSLDVPWDSHIYIYNDNKPNFYCMGKCVFMRDENGEPVGFKSVKEMKAIFKKHGIKIEFND